MEVIQFIPKSHLQALGWHSFAGGNLYSAQAAIKKKPLMTEVTGIKQIFGIQSGQKYVRFRVTFHGKEEEFIEIDSLPAVLSNFSIQVPDGKEFLKDVKRTLPMFLPTVTVTCVLIIGFLSFLLHKIANEAQALIASNAYGNASCDTKCLKVLVANDIGMTLKIITTGALVFIPIAYYLHKKKKVHILLLRRGIAFECLLIFAIGLSFSFDTIIDLRNFNKFGQLNRVNLSTGIDFGQVYRQSVTRFIFGK